MLLISWNIFQEKPKRGVEDMGFPGVLKKNHVEVLGVNLKRSAISRVVQEKTMWNFHGSLFLNLKFPRGVTKFCRNSRSESLFSLFLFSYFYPTDNCTGWGKNGTSSYLSQVCLIFTPNYRVKMGHL